MKLNVVLVAVAAPVVLTHTIFCQLDYAIRTLSYDRPENNVTVKYMACNGGSNPTTPPSNVVQAKAGTGVPAIWRKTLDTKTACAGTDDAIDPSHKVTDATTNTGIGDGCYKVQHEGYSGGKWGIETLISNAGEQLNTHSCTYCTCASSSKGARFFVRLSMMPSIRYGSGSKTPSTISFPAAD
ncbi:family 61 glycosyl hydrolase [Xylariales sp. AK1849]|nr:family 61 glycosyl hydrolase [Xylariales sp. AK1849]